MTFLVAALLAAQTEAASLTPVTVRVTPWADIAVDGHVVARGAFKLALELTPGTHVIAFHNPNALDVGRVVTVGTTPLQLNVTMERRPAYVVVHSNVADADVAVCAQGAVDEPVPVAVPRRQKVDVRVSRPGYSTIEKRVPVASGATTNVRVQLEANAASDYSPSPSPSPSQLPVSAQ